MLREQQGRRAADPTASTGNQGDLAFEHARLSLQDQVSSSCWHPLDAELTTVQFLAGGAPGKKS
jgi:hypothetical protein